MTPKITERKCQSKMALHKKYSLADSTQCVDLRNFENEIIETIETVAPGKHPKVFEDHFITDPLTQSEAVKIGRELSKCKDIARYGKKVETFRLFKGQTMVTNGIETATLDDGGIDNG